MMKFRYKAPGALLAPFRLDGEPVYNIRFYYGSGKSTLATFSRDEIIY